MAKYDKVKIIGSGTFGDVWLVKSKLSRQSYVMKEIKLNALNEIEQHQSLTEAAVLSKCKHTNIIKHKEAFIDETNHLLIVMEYAEGGDLASEIINQRGVLFPEHRVITWFIQICLALQYLHFKSILHRDLKARNIFLTRHKVIKIGDFGIARLLQNREELVNTAIGTPYYLSPEVFQRKSYNYKSDIWALGCVLFEMAALKQAFNAVDFFHLADLVLRGKRQELPRNYSPVIEELVHSLLKVEPGERPSTDEILENPSLQPYLSEYMATQNPRDSFMPIINEGYKTRLRRDSDAGDIFKAIEETSVKRRDSISSARKKPTKNENPSLEDVVKSKSRCPVNSRPLSKKYQKPSSLLLTGKSRRENELTYKIPNKKLNVLTNKTDKSDLAVSCDTYALPKTKDIHSACTSRLSRSEDPVLNTNDGYTCPTEPNVLLNNDELHSNNYCSETTRLCSLKGNLAKINNEDDVFLEANAESARNCSKKVNQSFGFSLHNHCHHSQCHQCVLDTLWKNRIRCSVGGSVDKDEYLRLKNKLVLLYKHELFQKVYKSLMYNWEESEIATTRNKFQSLINSLNYDQVQSLPLMMQLIQLDLFMKPTKLK